MYYAAWAIAGSLLIVSVWFLAFLPIPRLSAPGCGFWSTLWENRLRAAVFLGPLACGLALSLWAEKQLTKGYRNDRWTEAQLAPVRSLLDAAFWKWLGLGLLLIVVRLVVFTPHGLNKGGMIYIVSALFGTLNRLRQTIAPRVVSNGGLRDWKSLKPLHSDHWGEPVKHGGNDLLPS